MSISERTISYESNGRNIRSGRVIPPYARREVSGSLHDTLGTWYDPIYYTPDVFYDRLLNDKALNIRMGILASAAAEHGSDEAIPWHLIDWECVPMLSDSVEQTYLASMGGGANQAGWLLERYLSYDPSLNSYTLPYLATLSQNATYTLPNLIMTFKGSAEATIPRVKDLVKLWSNYTIDAMVPYVASTVRDYFGLNALIEKRKSYLRFGNTVSFPDLIANEVLLCLERNPRNVVEEIGKTLGPNILFAYALALEDTYEDKQDEFLREGEKLVGLWN